MTAPETKRLCPQCGLDLPASGGCPHCLLRLALGGEPGEPTGAESLRPPTGLQSRFFGDYEILGEIARGGMGVVYRARHLKLNRMVALKMIHSSQWISPEARMRFGMEVAAAAQLNHPNIVSLHESGEVKGTNFFTMRLVEGDTLAAHIKAVRAGGGVVPACQAPPLSSPATIAALLIKTARAVHHAHQRGILHRDLKPSNILIDPQGEPHVADFGLAKMLSDDSAVTFTESVLGSPNYMAPEQASGKRGELTTATDVYGLGAVLYEALTGSPPFVAATPVETLRKVVDEEPAAPRKLKPGLDADLETICLKCLQKSPAARYRTAEELADDLERWQQGLAIRARPVGPMGAAWRWGRRHPGMAVLGVAFLASLAALAVSASLAAWRVRSANQRTEALVTRMQVQKADDLFSEGETTKGLAMLAHVLRKDPAHAPATLRLLSALQHRSYALPVFPIIGQGGPLAASRAPADDCEWFTLTQMGAARSWNLQTGEKLGTLFDLKRTIRLAVISDDGRKMLIGFRDGATQLREGPGFGTVHELPSSEFGINAGAFSPSGRLAATAVGQPESSFQVVVRVWDTATGRALTPDYRHKLRVTDLQFTRDEQRLVTISSDARIRFWPASGEAVAPSLVLPQPGCLLARFDASGRWLAVGEYEGGIKVWDMQETSQPRWTFQHARRINDLAFNADASLLVSASGDDTAQVWDLAAGTPRTPPLRHGNIVNSARFSPDGQRVITASSDNTARLWDAATGQPLTEELPHESGLTSAAFTCDGQRVMTTTFGGAGAVWELRKPFVPTLRLNHAAPVFEVQFSPDGNRLVSGSQDGEVRVTDAVSGETRMTVRIEGQVRPVAFSPDGRRIAVGSDDHAVHLLDAASGQQVLPPFRHGLAVEKLELDRSGQRLLTVTWHQAHIWDIASGRQMGAPLVHRDKIDSAHFSADGRWVVTAARDNIVRLWSAATGEAVGRPIWEGQASSAEFSPDGKTILVAGRGSTAGLVSVATRQPEGPLLRHRGPVTCAVFNPDGSRIVTASGDQTAKVWAPGADEPLLHTLPHHARVMHAEFSSDGRMILTWSSDGVVKLWDAASGHLIADPIRHPAITFACLSPDGRRIALSSRDGTVLTRPVPAWKGGDVNWLITLAEQVARQHFTPPDRFDPLPRETQPAFVSTALHGGGTNLETRLQTWLRGAGSGSSAPPASK